MVRGKEYKNMQTELINKLKRKLLKLNRTQTEEDTILLYTTLHEDITELLQVVFDTLNNIARLEHSTLEDKSEFLKNYYNLKTTVHDDEEHRLFLESNDLFNDLIKIIIQQQIEILNDCEDALVRFFGYQEEQVAIFSAE